MRKLWYVLLPTLAMLACAATYFIALQRYSSDEAAAACVVESVLVGLGATFFFFNSRSPNLDADIAAMTILTVISCGSIMEMFSTTGLASPHGLAGALVGATIFSVGSAMLHEGCNPGERFWAVRPFILLLTLTISTIDGMNVVSVLIVFVTGVALSLLWPFREEVRSYVHRSTA